MATNPRFGSYKEEPLGRQIQTLSINGTHKIIDSQVSQIPPSVPVSPSVQCLSNGIRAIRGQTPIQVIRPGTVGIGNQIRYSAGNVNNNGGVSLVNSQGVSQLGVGNLINSSPASSIVKRNVTPGRGIFGAANVVSTAPVVMSNEPSTASESAVKGFDLSSLPDGTNLIIQDGKVYMTDLKGQILLLSITASELNVLQNTEPAICDVQKVAPANSVVQVSVPSLLNDRSFIKPVATGVTTIPAQRFQTNQNSAVVSSMTLGPASNSLLARQNEPRYQVIQNTAKIPPPNLQLNSNRLNLAPRSGQIRAGFQGVTSLSQILPNQKAPRARQPRKRNPGTVIHRTAPISIPLPRLSTLPAPIVGGARRITIPIPSISATESFHQSQARPGCTPRFDSTSLRSQSPVVSSQQLGYQGSLMATLLQSRAAIAGPRLPNTALRIGSTVVSSASCGAKPSELLHLRPLSGSLVGIKYMATQASKPRILLTHKVATTTSSINPATLSGYKLYSSVSDSVVELANSSAQIVVPSRVVDLRNNGDSQNEKAPLKSPLTSVHNEIDSIKFPSYASDTRISPGGRVVNITKVLEEKLENSNVNVSSNRKVIYVKREKRRRPKVGAVFRWIIPKLKRSLEVVWDGVCFKKLCLDNNDKDIQKNETNTESLNVIKSCSALNQSAPGSATVTSVSSQPQASPSELSLNSTSSITNVIGSASSVFFLCLNCKERCMESMCKKCYGMAIIVQAGNSTSVDRGMLPSSGASEKSSTQANHEVVQISDDEDESSTTEKPESVNNLSQASTNCATEHMVVSSENLNNSQPKTSLILDTEVTVAAASSSGDLVEVMQPALFSQPLRQFYVGTLPVLSARSCSYSQDGVTFSFSSRSSASGSDYVLMRLSDIQTMLIHFGPCGPVLFLLMTSQAAVGIRQKFGMTAKPPVVALAHYYDPCGRVESQRLITCIPSKPDVMREPAEIRTMLASLTAGLPGLQIKEITSDTTQQLLSLIMSSSTKIDQNCAAAKLQLGSLRTDISGISAQVEDEEEAEEGLRAGDRSRSPTPPPQPVFSGPVIKLFTYPPPPAPGGLQITNEDYFCLMPDEYLNDVVIDFYIKYVMLELLTAEDRSRTHVFSSFFYRRLTQREISNNPLNKTTEQQRHARVSTWTRKVDLFSKDFIIVPINESAHWYLAVICFPGLNGTVYESESTSGTEPTAAESSNCAGTEPTATDSNETAGTEPTATDSSSCTGTEPTAAVDSSCAGTEPTEGNTTGSEPSNESQETGDGKSATTEKVNSTKTNKRKILKQPCILIFDSLAMPARYGVVRTLRDYIQCEWDARKKASEGERSFDKESMKGACPRCPMQFNMSDCGVYVLQYIESFFYDPITDYSLPIKCTENWFSEQRISTKRDEIKRLIVSLQNKYNPDLVYDPESHCREIHSGTRVEQISGDQESSAAEKMEDEDVLSGLERVEVDDQGNIVPSGPIREGERVGVGGEEGVEDSLVLGEGVVEGAEDEGEGGADSSGVHVVDSGEDIYSDFIQPVEIQPIEDDNVEGSTVEDLIAESNLESSAVECNLEGSMVESNLEGSTVERNQVTDCYQVTDISKLSLSESSTDVLCSMIEGGAMIYSEFSAFLQTNTVNSDENTVVETENGIVSNTEDSETVILENSESSEMGSSAIEILSQFDAEIQNTSRNDAGIHNTTRNDTKIHSTSIDDVEMHNTSINEAEIQNEMHDARVIDEIPEVSTNSEAINDDEVTFKSVQNLVNIPVYSSCSSIPNGDENLDDLKCDVVVSAVLNNNTDQPDSISKDNQNVDTVLSDIIESNDVNNDTSAIDLETIEDHDPLMLNNYVKTKEASDTPGSFHDAFLGYVKKDLSAMESLNSCEVIETFANESAEISPDSELTVAESLTAAVDRAESLNDVPVNDVVTENQSAVV